MAKVYMMPLSQACRRCAFVLAYSSQQHYCAEQKIGSISLLYSKNDVKYACPHFYTSKLRTLRKRTQFTASTSCKKLSAIAVHKFTIQVCMQDLTLQKDKNMWTSMDVYHFSKTNSKWRMYNRRQGTLFRPIWTSSVQCRHWSGHMEKASSIPQALWLTLAEQVQTHCHPTVLKNKCKQVMSFARRI